MDNNNAGRQGAAKLAVPGRRGCGRLNLGLEFGRQAPVRCRPVDCAVVRSTAPFTVVRQRHEKTVARSTPAASAGMVARPPL